VTLTALRVGALGVRPRQGLRSPLFEPRRHAVGAYDSGVDRHQPVDVAGRIRLGLACLAHLLERAVQGPTAKAGVQRLPRAVPQLVPGYRLP
jgi:hypothetical protein